MNTRGDIVGAGRDGPALWRYGVTTPLPSVEGTYALRATLITADGTRIAGVSTDNGTLWACA